MKHIHGCERMAVAPTVAPSLNFVEHSCPAHLSPPIGAARKVRLVVTGPVFAWQATRQSPSPSTANCEAVVAQPKDGRVLGVVRGWLLVSGTGYWQAAYALRFTRSRGLQDWQVSVCEVQRSLAAFLSSNAFCLISAAFRAAVPTR
jgi:hypothetical protein